MASIWQLTTAPCELLNLSQLAGRVADGSIDTNDVVRDVNAEKLCKVYEICGLEHIVNRLHGGEGSSNVELFDTSEPKCHRIPMNGKKDSRSIAEGTFLHVPGFVNAGFNYVMRRVTVQPHPAWLASSLAFGITAVAIWIVDMNSQLRFPVADGAKALHQIALIKGISDTEFWLIELDLVLSCIVALGLAVKGSRG